MQKCEGTREKNIIVTSYSHKVKINFIIFFSTLFLKKDTFILKQSVSNVPRSQKINTIKISNFNCRKMLTFLLNFSSNWPANHKILIADLTCY